MTKGEAIRVWLHGVLAGVVLAALALVMGIIVGCTANFYVTLPGQHAATQPATQPAR